MRVSPMLTPTILPNTIDSKFSGKGGGTKCYCRCTRLHGTPYAVGPDVQQYRFQRNALNLRGSSPTRCPGERKRRCDGELAAGDCGAHYTTIQETCENLVPAPDVQAL